jgi:hypothetical protein
MVWVGEVLWKSVYHFLRNDVDDLSWVVYAITALQKLRLNQRCTLYVLHIDKLA